MSLNKCHSSNQTRSLLISFKSNKCINKKEGGSDYVVSASFITHSKKKGLKHGYQTRMNIYSILTSVCSSRRDLRTQRGASLFTKTVN